MSWRFRFETGEIGFLFSSLSFGLDSSFLCLAQKEIKESSLTGAGPTIVGPGYK